MKRRKKKTRLAQRVVRWLKGLAVTLEAYDMARNPKPVRRPRKPKNQPELPLGGDKT
jgi:hypothetical protein